MIIKNGTIVDPINNRMYKADIRIDNGIISKIDEALSINDVDADIIDATGLYIGPGLCDTHVHFRDPGFTHKEDILTGAEAAKMGGYTQIVLMANTKPTVDSVETLEYVINKGKDTGINIHTCANVTYGMKGQELTDMDALYEAGAVGFTDDGVPILNADICKKAMKLTASFKAPISFHEENPEFIKNNGVNHGVASDYYKIYGSDRQAEIDMVSRDIELARECKAEGENPIVVIQHISTAEGVELVRKAKADGLNIHAEATPHHFTLTEEAVIKYGTFAKMNPPLRTDADREAVRKGLQDGTIDMIATDHAPHAGDEKAKSITDAPSGIIGLETAFSLAIRELVNKGYLSYPELFNRMSYAPTQLYGLTGGEVAEGLPADMVIFNPSGKWTYTENMIRSKSHNSPFIGEELPGIIKYTLCNGKVVYSR